MVKESKKWYAATVILYLVPFGVVAAGIVISFGSICFLLLATSRETLVGSRIGEARVVVDHSCSPSPNTDRPATRIAAQADSPSSVELKILIPSAARDLTTSDMQLEGFISYWNFGTQPDRELSPTIRESQDASPTQFAPTDEVPPARIGEPQHVTIPAMPMAEPVSVSPSASSTPSLAVPIVEKDREQDPRPPGLDQAAMATQDPALANPGQSERSGEHALSSKAAFQDRVRKECGPISDRELHYQCILSFRFHYR
jgi:hypothetical protein